MEGKFITKKGIATLLSVLSACGVASAVNEGQCGDATLGINQGKPTYAQWRARRNSLARSTPNLSTKNSLAGSAPDLGANCTGKKIENISDSLRKRVSRRKVAVGAANLESDKVDSKSADKKSLVVIPGQSNPSRPGLLEVQDVSKKGTWNPFKVLSAGFNGMYDGWKRLGLSTGQEIFIVTFLSELFSYIATNKGIGEHLTHVFVDLLATNIAKIFKKEGVFKTTREYYNVDMARQDVLISKMIPGLNYLACVFASVKGNWIDCFVAFITGCLGKPSSDLKMEAAKEFISEHSTCDMTFADAKKSVDVLKEYIRSVGFNFRRTRLNMMVYRLGGLVRSLATKEAFDIGKEEP